MSGNKVMVATFALHGLDHASTLREWTRRIDVDWDRAIFVITGRQGRPTAGLTKSTTSLVRVLRHLSGDYLALERTFIMPTAPGFDPPRGDDLSAVVAAEAPLRWLVARVMSSVELAPVMYDGYARFAEPPLLGAELAEGEQEISEFPPIRSVDDWDSMTTRLRLTLEDPRQLLATGVTDFIAEQLMRVNGEPRAVVVPGLDTEDYPYPVLDTLLTPRIGMISSAPTAAAIAPVMKRAGKFCGLAAVAPMSSSAGAMAGTTDEGSELASPMIPMSLAGFFGSGRIWLTSARSTAK